jgi:GTP-binding protein
VILAVNKCDTREAVHTISEASRLGFGEPVELSAAHGRGIDELYHALNAIAPEEAHDVEDDESEDEAVVEKRRDHRDHGPANAGKSTLLNRLLGQERSITGPEAGITRDGRGGMGTGRRAHQAHRHRRAAA